MVMHGKGKNFMVLTIWLFFTLFQCLACLMRFVLLVELSSYVFSFFHDSSSY